MEPTCGSYPLKNSTAKKYFWTNSDGQQLLIREWLLPQPEYNWKREAHANVLIIHGIHEHSGYYEELAVQFHKVECNVVSFDLPGHGESEGERFMIADFDAVVRDILGLVIHYRSISKVPTYLFGTNIGATLAVIAATRDRHRIRGLMLQGIFMNLMKPDEPDKPIREFARMCKSICPTFPVIHFPIQDLTRDLQIVSDIFIDPLYYTDKAKGTTIVAFVKIIQRFDKLIRQELKRIPLFIIHGEEDKISPRENSDSLMKIAFACGDKTFHIGYQCFHQVHTDPQQKEPLFKKLIEWIKIRYDKHFRRREDDTESEI